MMRRNPRARWCSRDRDVHLETRLVHVRTGLAEFGEGAFRGFGYLAGCVRERCAEKKKEGGLRIFIRATHLFRVSLLDWIPKVAFRLVCLARVWRRLMSG